MEETEGLAYDDPWSDSNAMVMGADGSQGPADSPPNTSRSLALHWPGLPMEHMLPLEPAVTGMDAVEVHIDEEELNDL